ncbi:MAG: hypothetical protein ACRD3J_01225 [Thermoanaerobaculia bacterium]
MTQEAGEPAAGSFMVSTPRPARQGSLQNSGDVMPRVVAPPFPSEGLFSLRFFAYIDIDTSIAAIMISDVDRSAAKLTGLCRRKAGCET